MNYQAFTKQAAKALRCARRLAGELHQTHVGTEYILAGLLETRDGVAFQVLQDQHVNFTDVHRLVQELAFSAEEGSPEGNDIFTPEAESLAESALTYSRQFECSKAGTEHLLYAMIHDRESAAAKILIALEVNFAKVYGNLLLAMGKESLYSKEESKALRTGRSSDENSTPMLARYASDLTARARKEEMDPLIGREEEMQRLIQILSRRGKNNPCLIGEPGVGKTAIVEGLARQIVLGLVPEHLRHKRILTLDISGMVAGSKYRGEFEERIKGAMREVQDAGDIILFIDELHTIIGAGSAEGTMDASNIMKPALSRGKVQVIGATTIQEYRKHIEKDTALERRFQPLMVEEPSVEETIAILEGLKSRYEEYHHVTITEDGIRAAAELSARYINDRFLPDKAIDLMDEAAAKTYLNKVKKPVELREITEKMRELQEELDQCLSEQDWGGACESRSLRKELQDDYDRILQKYQRSQKRKSAPVNENAVADVVADWVHIPVKRITEGESVRLKRMEASLHKRVIAQDEAVTAVSKAVRRGRVGLKDPGRPIGSFLFLGPTGVGKTEISKALAEEVFGVEDAMIRVDMSEYMEKHSVSKLIGSPPGYVGYDEGGQLSEQVRRHPYSVILFDEIEKAHPDVFNILLQVLDDGHITDSQGRKVDFKNTIIIMTSNAGAQSIIEPKRLGFSAHEDVGEDYQRMKSNVMEEVRRIFKPEFLNRIDETIVFHALGKEDMKQIAALMIRELKTRCKKQLDLELTVTGSVKTHIVEKAYDPKYGARPLRRMIQTGLEDALADAMLAGEISRGDRVKAALKKGKVVFERV